MPKGKGSQKVRHHLMRVVVPVVGLLAVTTALALVGIAPILLFPASKDAGPRAIAPSASSEVASVAAPPLRSKGGSPSTGPAESPAGPAVENPPASTPGAGPNPVEGGGTVSPPEQPSIDPPGNVARPGGGRATDDEDQDEGKGKGHGKGTGEGKGKGEGKEKPKHGKALGHSKDKAKGEAKGHEKWQGRAAVAFPPRAAKPGHVHPAPTSQHSGRGHRPHARSRG